jgi:hypothetical protein
VTIGTAPLVILAGRRPHFVNYTCGYHRARYYYGDVTYEGPPRDYYEAPPEDYDGSSPDQYDEAPPDRSYGSGPYDYDDEGPASPDSEY